jgi:hypothetical protein
MKIKGMIKVEIPKESAQYILDILVDHQDGYSQDYPPERILKIREVIGTFKEKLV